MFQKNVCFSGSVQSSQQVEGKQEVFPLNSWDTQAPGPGLGVTSSNIHVKTWSGLLSGAALPACHTQQAFRVVFSPLESLFGGLSLPWSYLCL